MQQDCFALLGLPREYSVDPASVDAAYARAGGGSDARLTDARAVLIDPVRRAAHLLDLFGAPPADASVPMDLASELDALQAQAASAKKSGDATVIDRARQTLAAAREARVAQIGRMFGFTRGMPNAVAQTSRDAAIRAQINAVHKIDALAQDL